MFRSSIILASLSLVLHAQSAMAVGACDDFVKSYSEYTQKVDGKIVKKHSIFEMTDWARNSRFQGLVLTDKAPANAEVILESKTSSKAKTVTSKAKKIMPFTHDEKYRVVELDLLKQLGSAPTQEGSYTVKILADGKEVCSEKKLIYNDGD
ncbi:MAG: hypothetical protein V4654_09600 [Bdellovibrionota bacterium]